MDVPGRRHARLDSWVVWIGDSGRPARTGAHQAQLDYTCSQAPGQDAQRVTGPQERHSGRPTYCLQGSQSRATFRSRCIWHAVMPPCQQSSATSFRLGQSGTSMFREESISRLDSGVARSGVCGRRTGGRRGQKESVNTKRPPDRVSKAVLPMSLDRALTNV